MKTLQLTVIGKNKTFTGTSCVQNLCCTCKFKGISFTYTADGGNYTTVPAGTSGSFTGVEVWDEKMQNVYLIDALELDIAKACNECTDGECFVVDATAQTFEPIRATLAPFCITRTKADVDYPTAEDFILDYMQYGIGVVAFETATELNMTIQSLVSPVPQGTDVVASGVCVCA